ncbi:MAG TPA: response regulator [Spirochaetia bacterium]|nr:response regulator [Spirochaetia bacterium]
MHRILVVDDETSIATSLAASLSEELAAGQFEVSAAFSAADALRRMEQRRTDIVISDIQMPRMDGLELGRAVQARWPDCRFIFLTGHGEFRYAQEALRAGCVDYILKTEGDERVLAVVRETARRLDAERLDREQRVQEQRALEDLRRASARRYLADFARGRAPARQEASEQAPEALPRILSHFGAEALSQGRLFVAVLVTTSPIEAVLSAAAAAFLPAAVVLDFPLDELSGVFLAAAPPVSPTDPTLVRGILESVQDTIRSGAQPFSFALDPEPVDLSALPARVARLEACLAGRSEAAGAAIVLGADPAGPLSAGLDLVAQVNAYVDAHLAEDVSLTRLAEAVSLNPSYLSRLYLQRAGIHLSERIASVRLEQAKALLAEGRLKVSEIAAAVGFWTPSHFIRFFKQRTGVTPQAFRST